MTTSSTIAAIGERFFVCMNYSFPEPIAPEQIGECLISPSTRIRELKDALLDDVLSKSAS